jgi:hypothetical protein
MPGLKAKQQPRRKRNNRLEEAQKVLATKRHIKHKRTFETGRISLCFICLFVAKTGLSFYENRFRENSAPPKYIDSRFALIFLLPYQPKDKKENTSMSKPATTIDLSAFKKQLADSLERSAKSAGQTIVNE